jgi:hypothetical protein
MRSPALASDHQRETRTVRLDVKCGRRNLSFRAAPLDLSLVPFRQRPVCKVLEPYSVRIPSLDVREQQGALRRKQCVPLGMPDDPDFHRTAWERGVFGTRLEPLNRNTARRRPGWLKVDPG